MDWPPSTYEEYCVTEGITEVFRHETVDYWVHTAIEIGQNVETLSHLFQEANMEVVNDVETHE